MEPANLVPRLTPIQRYALLYAGASGGEPIRGKLWFQKGLFLLAQKNPSLSEELGYEAALIGPFSDSLEWHLGQLEGIGLLESQDSRFRTTEFGDRRAQLLREELTQDELRQIEEVKDLLNDLPKDELLALVYALYPEMTSESEELERILPKRRELAISLYRKDKVGLELGARVAGLSVQEFASVLSERGLRKYAE